MGNFFRKFARVCVTNNKPLIAFVCFLVRTKCFYILALNFACGTFPSMLTINGLKKSASQWQDEIHLWRRYWAKIALTVRAADEKRTFSAELPAQRNLGKTERQKERKFPPISSNVNKSYNEPAVTKANLPAAIQDNKKKTPLRGGGNIGKTFHERADSFTQTNAKNEVTNRKKKGARRKDQEKKDESSFTDMVNKYKSMEGMKSKFPLKTMVRNGCFSSHMAH